MNINKNLFFLAQFILFSFFIFSHCNLGDNEEIYIDEQLPWPERVSITSISSTSLKVEWIDVMQHCNDCFYRIERAVDSSGFTLLQEQFKNNYYYDYDVDAGKRYSYRITTYNNEKSSFEVTLRARYDQANDLKTVIDFPNSWGIKLSNNKQLLSVVGNDTITILDVNTWSRLITIKVGSKSGSSVQFSDDDSKIIFDADTLIKIANTSDGSIIHTIALTHQCYGFSFNTDMSRFLAHTWITIPYQQNEFLDCVDYNGNRLWRLERTDFCSGSLYRASTNEFIALTENKIMFLNSQDGSANYTLPFKDCSYEDTEFARNKNDLVTLCYSNGAFIFKLNLDTKNRIDTGTRWGRASNLAYVENGNYYIYANDNMIAFHNEGQTWDYFTFAPFIDWITDLEYSSVTGDIILSTLSGIYVYSSQKSYKWFAYPYYGNHD